ncbi:MAG: hypothetical protein SGBAC_009045 [Bacillariaceae sp.]
MMQPENVGGVSPIPSPKKDDDTTMNADVDVEAPSDSKGKMPGGEEMTLDKLKIRLLAMTEYLRRELSTMDAEKAKHLSLLAKEKALAMALALKALSIQYFNELKQMDKEKAREIGLKYQGKAKELGVKYKEKTIQVAGVARQRTTDAAAVARLKAIEVAKELKTLDKAQAKQKSIAMMQKSKGVYKEMSVVTKIQWGVVFLMLFFISGGSPGGHKGVKHPRLCYISERFQAAAACENMLTSVTKGYTNWIFIGNEPLFALFNPFRDHIGDEDDKVFKQTKGDRRLRRKIVMYYKYELPDDGPWKEKYVNQENPTELAAEAGIGQTDCKGCNMMKLEKKDSTVVLEILAVESSRDVSQVTTETSTTQETVARYLKETYPNKKQTACVVQQGSYEMKQAPWRSAEEYADNTRDFHNKLEEHCGILIRIGNFLDTGDLKEKTQTWNKGARDVVLHQSRNGYFIDVGQVGNPSMDGYITPVWEMFARLSKALD